MDFYELLRLEGKTIEKAKHEHIFVQGDSDRSFYRVQSGLLKAYYTSKKGKESVKSFILPEDTICSLTSAYSEGGCSFSLICLEATILIKIPFAKLYEYSQKHHEIANKIIELLLGLAMKKEKREFEFLCLSAEERYHLLVEASPKLLETVTQNDIARYLGVTPVGLSRIKNREHNN